MLLFELVICALIVAIGITSSLSDPPQDSPSSNKYQKAHQSPSDTHQQPLAAVESAERPSKLVKWINVPPTETTGSVGSAGGEKSWLLRTAERSAFRVPNLAFRLVRPTDSNPQNRSHPDLIDPLAQRVFVVTSFSTFILVHSLRMIYRCHFSSMYSL